jgi:acetolactate synthase-1/2/3 large subunit
MQISSPSKVDAKVKAALAEPNAVICEVFVKGDCLVTPRTATQVLPDGTMRSSPLENQFPFLDDTELTENILE